MSRSRATGWSGSTLRTAPRMAGSNVPGGTAARTTTLSPQNAARSDATSYSCGAFGRSSEDCRASPTTPTISMSGPAFVPRCTRRPIGSWPGQATSANLADISATRADSTALNARPRSNGNPSTRRQPDVTLRGAALIAVAWPSGR